MNVSLESAPQIFEPEYYQRLYDIEENHWWAQGMRDAMVALLRKPTAGMKNIQVLDIGCGTGYLLEFVQRNYPLASEPIGLDVSEHALKFCEMRGAKKLVLGSATEVPVPSNSVDLIICIDTLQHLSPAGSDEKAVAEFMRLLAPGGLLYLRTNSSLGHVPLKGADADHYRRYNVPLVTSMLQKAGFVVERSTYLNALPSAFGAAREYLKALSGQEVRHQCAHQHNHEHSHDHGSDHEHGHEHKHSLTQTTKAIGPGLAIKNYSKNLSWLNTVMHWELAAEAWLIGQNIELPFGHSCGFVARKP